ncbi:LuxR C-terminal-related transcriptional regulator [Microbacterium sp. AZCO]|uniref:LuxR C-terminal-related transcriptional regulator n=1 Tax=Microbacterium sp. AZCO TaxID=3142976 RepID=UPI0031F3B5BB
MEHALAPWPLAGRDEVVDRAVAGLEGLVRTLVVSGESGVGKSRVAATVGEVLAARGWTVLSAGATSIMSGVPLGALLTQFPGDRAQLAASAADPATLLARAIDAVEARGPAPRVLVLDDLGLLDPLSTTLIAQLVASDVLRLVATIRSGDPLPDAVIATWNADRSARLDLAPLDPDAIAALLARVLGSPVAHRSVTELHRATGGNPLFLRELVLGALDAGRLVPQAGVWQLTGEAVGSPALRDLILARIAQLDADERDLVERLAVCGELAASHLPDSRAPLARLEAAGIVAIGPQLEVTLGHPQYGAIVRSSLSRLRAADLLLEQADILTQHGRGTADDLRAVVWRLEAGVSSDPELLISTALLAQQAGDFPTVERLCTAAIAAGARRPDVLLIRGAAHLRMGRNDEALADLRAARELAPEGQLASSIAATTAMAHAMVHEGIRDALAVLSGAEADLGYADPGLELTRAQIELWDNRVFDADRVVRGVSDLLGDSMPERAIVAAAHAQPLAAIGHDDEALAAAHTALAFARATSDNPVPGHTVADALHTLGIVQLHAGLVNDARATAKQALVEAIGADDEIVTRSIEFLLGRIAADAGQMETAARWYRDTMSGALTVGPVSLYVPALASLAITLAQHGDVDAARRELESLPAGVDAGPGGILAHAWLNALDGDLDSARTALRAGAVDTHATGHNFLAGTYLFTLARLGDPGAAAADLTALEAESPGGLLALQASHAQAEASRDRARLATVGENWSAQGAHLLAAEAFASASRAARAEGDSRAAVALQARSDEEAAQCEGATTPLLRFSEERTPLTRREREIAALAASGASSKEIAAKLFLSTRTVDNHLQSVYGKLGISGRHELARL